MQFLIAIPVATVLLIFGFLIDLTPTVLPTAIETQNADQVGIMDAWVREADPKAKANAGYMTLINPGANEVTLVEVRCAEFDKVEMHEMTVVNGAMKMRELDSLTIPANGKIEFSPGGQHLMMKGPRDYLGSGQTVDLTLVFKSGNEQHVSVRVAAR